MDKLSVFYSLRKKRYFAIFCPITGQFINFSSFVVFIAYWLIYFKCMLEWHQTIMHACISHIQLSSSPSAAAADPMLVADSAYFFPASVGVRSSHAPSHPPGVPVDSHVWEACHCRGHNMPKLSLSSVMNDVIMTLYKTASVIFKKRIQCQSGMKKTHALYGKLNMQHKTVLLNML